MQYQITYNSPAGHARALAAAFQSILPRDTLCCSLDDHPSAGADVHLVGLEFSDADLSRLPDEVRSFLATLEGRSIVLFATVPLEPNDVIEKSVSDLVVPALPRDCDYLGLYVCPAQPSAALLGHLEEAMTHDPGNGRAKYWHQRCGLAMGHPDSGDLQAGCRFAAHVLQLDRSP